MTVHIPIHSTNCECITWLWTDADGKDISLGDWVRTTPTSTRVDYGRVYELLPTGKISVEWKNTATMVPVQETPTELQLSTWDHAQAFIQGLDLGYQNGFRAGMMVQINQQRESIGLPRLSDEEFDAVVIDGGE